jgi:hypothetical protein
MRINLYGGAGIGKSRLSEFLADSIGRAGVPIELVQEAIKPQAYRGEWPTPWGNHTIFSKQLERERNWLESGVPNVVTDSPIFLQCFYMARVNAPPTLGCLHTAREWEKSYPAFNIMLERSEDIKYQQAGRYQDQKEAEKIDTEIRRFLDGEGVTYTRVTACDRAGILALALAAIRDEKPSPYWPDTLEAA